MSYFSNRLLHCLAFSFLFFVAATADLMVTSCITDGHHANNPLVRIEHKSVASLDKSASPEKSDINHGAFAAIGLVPSIHEEVWFEDHSSMAIPSSLTSVLPLTPLRC
jgi:hypothetical protein